MAHTNTMDGFILDDLSVSEAKKALGVKSKAKTAKTASKKAEDSSLDLVGVMIIALSQLVWRFIKTLWKYRVGLAASAFIVENMLLIQHHFDIFFK